MLMNGATAIWLMKINMISQTSHFEEKGENTLTNNQHVLGLNNSFVIDT